jgi:hypothetical protein
VTDAGWAGEEGDRAVQQPPQQPWGYRPPRPERAPGGPRPWYRHPVGLLLIAAVAVIVVALVAPAFFGGGREPAPTVTTGALPPRSTVGPGATTGPTGTTAAEAADRLRQAVQQELGGVGTVTDVQAPPGRPVAVTWEITAAGSEGLTRNNARFGVMRIMRAVQQSEAGAGAGHPGARLVGRFRLPGAATPVTVVRLRFSEATEERTRFDDRRYLEAFELADAAVIHPAFRG